MAICCTSDDKVVLESWASGRLPLIREPIRIVPASTAAASKSISS